MRSKFFLPFLISIFILMGIISPLKAHAVSPSSIFFNLAPKDPGPNENTTITLSSYSSNLDTVLISWSVDGKIVSSGIGKKFFSFQSPDTGKEINVSAVISLPDGEITKSTTIRPAFMTLLWQADDSYVPPFYRGKALPTTGSAVKIVALPEIKNGSGVVDSANMTYSWKKDYTNDANGSGYGKNAFTYINDYLDDGNTISVSASTVDQKFSSKASIDVAMIEPKIMFYKNDAKLGTLWENAILDGHIVTGSEVLEAAPYYISPANIRVPTLTFNWFINDYQIAVESYRKTRLPVAVQPGTSGTSIIRLEIESTDKIFASSKKEIGVQF
jgi:hypothetical protein